MQPTHPSSSPRMTTIPRDYNILVKVRRLRKGNLIPKLKLIPISCNIHYFSTDPRPPPVAFAPLATGPNEPLHLSASPSCRIPLSGVTRFSPSSLLSLRLHSSHWATVTRFPSGFWASLKNSSPALRRTLHSGRLSAWDFSISLSGSFPVPLPFFLYLFIYSFLLVYLSLSLFISLSLSLCFCIFTTTLERAYPRIIPSRGAC